MRRTRRIVPSILCGILIVSFFACSTSASFAQTPGQLPHAWNEAVYALAQKIAAALGNSHAFSLDVKDVSSTAPVDLAGIRQTLEDDIGSARRPLRAPSG